MNVIRSPMAEVIAREMLPRGTYVASAGVRAGERDPNRRIRIFPKLMTFRCDGSGRVRKRRTTEREGGRRSGDRIQRRASPTPEAFCAEQDVIVTGGPAFPQRRPPAPAAARRDDSLTGMTIAGSILRTRHTRAGSRKRIRRKRRLRP